MRHPSPTPFQRQVAAALNINIAGDSRDVVAAKMADYLGDAVRDGRPPRPSTEKQRDYANSLGFDVSADTISIASAKIAQHLFALNKQALRKLRLKPGNRVRLKSNSESEAHVPNHWREFVVSSIQPNARVYFKGIGCQGAWPVQLEKIT